MPILCFFRGIKIYINWNDHNPPHFHAEYGGDEVTILIDEIEVDKGWLPPKQLKLVLGWAVLHQEELRENWLLAQKDQETYRIDPLR
ncbi:MAG: DUF4160 domain-containing protein [Eubacteriales bacterium]|nr:DUF4160 domain-containing protein [Eubacteriales bacterium]